MYIECTHADNRKISNDVDDDESPGQSDVEIIYGTRVITQQHDDSKYDYASSLDPAFLRDRSWYRYK